mmetsp:Transcript_31939/g.42582  ORF Transcript_31939/g.42582 Transcript_31939/m.42582 type:complete len:215 (+) Transcript_31939:1251-1895(+)
MHKQFPRLTRVRRCLQFQFPSHILRSRDIQLITAYLHPLILRLVAIPPIRIFTRAIIIKGKSRLIRTHKPPRSSRRVSPVGVDTVVTTYALRIVIVRTPHRAGATMHRCGSATAPPCLRCVPRHRILRLPRLYKTIRVAKGTLKQRTLRRNALQRTPRSPQRMLRPVMGRKGCATGTAFVRTGLQMRTAEPSVGKLVVGRWFAAHFGVRGKRFV